jgi:MurNAc alpha-1-phosphate uridylyltransferase
MSGLQLTHAMILAAGLGTRMRPLTLDVPKPLIPVAGKALIDWNIDWLSAAGITEVVVNSSYLADKLEAHLAVRTAPRIHLSREGSPPLETGGGVKKALPLLGTQPFLTMNSDAILPLQEGAAHPVQQLADAWDDDVDFLLLVVPRAQAIGWEGNGDFVVDGAGRTRRPAAGEDAPYIFTGVEIMHPRVFANAPEGAFSLSKLWARGQGDAPWLPRVRALVHAGPWLNVGALQGLAVAERYYGVAATGI